jgi:hypothetical protein
MILGCRPPLSQQCGRCRLHFPGDPSLDGAAQAAWWLCPPCRDVLLGTSAARHPSGRRRLASVKRVDA